MWLPPAPSDTRPYRYQNALTPMSKKCPGTTELDGGATKPEVAGVVGRAEEVDGRPHARLNGSPRPPRQHCRSSIRGGTARIGGEEECQE
jgi:hypothetical protein